MRRRAVSRSGDRLPGRAHPLGAPEVYETHVLKRPATKDWHDAIARALLEPELVAELPGGAWAYYRRGVLPARYGDLYLFVVVRWNGALGDIATAFATDRIKHFVRLVRVNK